MQAETRAVGVWVCGCVSVWVCGCVDVSIPIPILRSLETLGIHVHISVDYQRTGDAALLDTHTHPLPRTHLRSPFRPLP